MARKQVRDYYDLVQNTEPVCPYCGEENPLEDGGGSDGDDFDMQCRYCDKTFTCTTVVTVKYSTIGSCAANGELPHTLKQPWVESAPFECTKCHAEFYSWQLPGGKYPRLKGGEYTILPKCSNL